MKVPGLDGVGPWSKRKLILLTKYLDVYTKIISNQKKKWCEGMHYIDAFAGAGQNLDRDTQQLLDGSPRIALQEEPPFDRLVFIEMKPEKAVALRELQREYPDRDIDVREGDCNELLPGIFDSLSRWDRAFLLLDPYNLGVDWKTIELAATAGNHKAVEILVNFSILHATRTVGRTRRELVSTQMADTMTTAWGNDEWVDCIFESVPTLFGSSEEKAHGVAERLANGFKDRLAKVYEHVSEPKIMRSNQRSPLYALILASHVRIAPNIIQTIKEYAEG